MRKSIATTGAILVILLSSSFLLAESPVESSQTCLGSFFTNSLHYTGESMRRWYEEKCIRKKSLNCAPYRLPGMHCELRLYQRCLLYA